MLSVTLCVGVHVLSVVCVVVVVAVVVVVVCVCGVVWHTENTRVLIQDARVYIQNVPVFAATHGDVLNVHTGGVLDGHTERGHRQFCLPRKAHVQFSLAPEKFTNETLGSYPFFSLRIGQSIQHVPDSSNHSLYQMKLLSSSYPEGKMEQAVRWFGLSVAPFSK